MADEVLDQVDQNVVDDVDQTIEEVETVETDVEAVEGDQESSEMSGKSEISGKAISDAVREASAQFPEQAKVFKQLKDAYFHNQAFSKAFPTAAEAQSVATLISDMGGVEGITNIQEKLGAYDAQDKALGEGSPEVLDSFFKDFPDGAAKLAPSYLEKLGQSNPQAQANAIVPYIAGFLVNDKVWGNHNLPSFLDLLANETDPKNIQSGIAELKQWVNRTYQNGVQANEGAKSSVKPVDSRLTERETALNNRELENKKTDLSNRFNSEIGPTVKNEVAKYAKQYKLNPVQSQHYQKELQASIDYDMNHDKTYQKQIEIRVNNPQSTVETLAKFASAEYNRRVKEKAFEVIKTIYGAPRGGNTKISNEIKPTTPKTSTTGGPIRIAEKPETSQIDWDKPNAQLNFISQKAWLKNGRFVTWRN